MKKIIPESLFDFKFVSAPSISPDGSMTAFIVSFASKEANNYFANIWLMDNATGEYRQLTGGGDGRSFIWTKNNTILFPALRCPLCKKKAEAGEPITQYNELDPKGGEAMKKFSIDETVTGIKEIGDGKYVISYNHDKRFDAIADLKEKGVWVFGAAGEGSVPMYRADLTGPAAIVIGNEGDGMSQLVRKNCDVMVHIPMKGKISSLNASAAASILLYEAVRQRLS
mgnify:CR=1 FL=1